MYSKEDPGGARAKPAFFMPAGRDGNANGLYPFEFGSIPNAGPIRENKARFPYLEGGLLFLCLMSAEFTGSPREDQREGGKHEAIDTLIPLKKSAGFRVFLTRQRA